MYECRNMPQSDGLSVMRNCSINVQSNRHKTTRMGNNPTTASSMIQLDRNIIFNFHRFILTCRCNSTIYNIRLYRIGRISSKLSLDLYQILYANR